MAELALSIRNYFLFYMKNLIGGRMLSPCSAPFFPVGPVGPVSFMFYFCFWPRKSEIHKCLDYAKPQKRVHTSSHSKQKTDIEWMSPFVRLSRQSVGDWINSFYTVCYFVQQSPMCKRCELNEWTRWRIQASRMPACVKFKLHSGRSGWNDGQLR